MPANVPAEMLMILANPASSQWLKDAVITASLRDPLDAAHDAEVLASVTANWVDSIIEFELAEANAMELELLEESHDPRFTS